MKWFTIIKIFMSLNQYKKILVIKHGSLGDITFALPAMNSIRIYFKYSAITLFFKIQKELIFIILFSDS